MWDLYPANDPKAPCFVHIHGGYWQRGSKEIFACLSEGPLARGWSAALCGYTLAPEASLTQTTNELKSAFISTTRPARTASKDRLSSPAGSQAGI
jgi:acetyl esterase/lipase